MRCAPAGVVQEAESHMLNRCNILDNVGESRT